MNGVYFTKQPNKVTIVGKKKLIFRKYEQSSNCSMFCKLTV